MPIHRRSLLRSLPLGASAGLLGPFARLLAAEAAGAPPRRFVLFQTANGLPRSLYRQEGLPAAKDIKAPLEAPLVLREIMAPLARWRDRMLLLEGFANPFDQDLHGNVFASLCVRPRSGKGGPGGVSLDRLVAQSLGKDEAFSSLALATVWHGNDSYSRAADGPQAPYPADALPQTAFAKIFTAGAASTAGVDPAAAALARATRRQSLLDFVRDDTRRLRERAGGLGQRKLEQYTESLRAVEKQVLVQAQKASSCKGTAPGVAFTRTMNPGDAQLDAQVAIAAQALICGMTRVVNLSFGTSDGGISHYGFPALKNTGSHHVYCHAGNAEAQREIHTYVFQKIANFLARLDEVPEAGGTMLDNTLVLVVNDGGGNHHGGWNDIPLLIIGRAGGALRTGRVVSYPVGSRVTCDAFVSVLHALGIPAKSFGDPAVNRGPLTELA